MIFLNMVINLKIQNMIQMLHFTFLTLKDNQIKLNDDIFKSF